MSKMSEIVREIFDNQQHNQAILDDRNKRILEALSIAVSYGGTCGDWHKAWVIDQMVRVLCGSPERYAELVKDACDGENGPATFEWDVGIPP